MKRSLLTVTTLLLTIGIMQCDAFTTPFPITGMAGDCPNMDRPVCCTNNNTYQNDCMLQKAGAVKAHDGWCNYKPPVGAIPVIIGRADLTVFVKDAKNGFLPDGRPYSVCACDFTFNPVCGENGVTYANYCRANCKNVKPVHYGQCGAISYDLDEKNKCQCDFTFSPICGTNGITYENSCVTGCFNASADFNGYCTLPCACQFYFRPVCGENGRNYVNQCLLDCAQVAKFSDGICANDTKCGNCYGEIKRVCGRDGKTYDNECYLDCAGAKKQHDGYCVEKWQNVLYNPFNKTQGGYSMPKVDILSGGLQKCFCPTIYLPVCGKNNVTYVNECVLNCAGVVKAKNGACEDGDDNEDMCNKKSKIKNYEPVCGSNRVTYYNKSMITCESGVSLLYEGECKPIYYEWCKCASDYIPVCGVDGRTYLNEEVIKCVGVDKYCDGSCELGAKGWKVGPEQKGLIGHNKRADEKDKRFDSNVNEYWYNAIWGKHKGHWNCNRQRDNKCTCEPNVNPKYMLVKRPTKKGCVVFMPPCKNLDYFELPYKKNKFPGFHGFIPDSKYLTFVIENSYTKEKAKVDDILEKVFKDNDNQIEALNFFIPLDSDFKSEFEVKQKVAAKHRKNIPKDHKDLMMKDPTLYYLYFTLLIEQKMVEPDTPINDDYCVRDALFYIVQDVWKLDLDLVIQSDADLLSLDFDTVVSF